MASAPITNSIFHEYSEGWIRENPELAAKSIGEGVLRAINDGLTDIRLRPSDLPGMTWTLVCKRPVAP